jgi:hypothetical protein
MQEAQYCYARVITSFAGNAVIIAEKKVIDWRSG